MEKENKQNIFNTVLFIIIIILILLSLGLTIYKKIDEKKKAYSYQKMLKIYNEIVYNEKNNIYLFYGDGCPHCASEEEFFNSIESTYGENYNLVKFETWNNQNNQKLKELVVDKLIEENYIVLDENKTLENYYKSVPLLIIDDKTFLGYSNKMDEAIVSAILEQKEYDIMKELDLK